MTRKLILSESESHTQQYVKENQLSPRDYVVVTSVEKLYGTSPEEWELVELGSWQNRFNRHDSDDFWRIREYLFSHRFWTNDSD